jgi:5'-3' exonuclease
VVVMTPDKDMAQLVREDGRVVTFDRRKRTFMDADGVREKFGVSPASIPDYLALVGDSADGYPGVPGWGAKSAAAVLTRYPHLEEIPESVRGWDVAIRGGATLAQSLRDHRDEAFLFRELATLRADAPIPESLEDLEWRGVPREPFKALADVLAAPELRFRVPRWAA